MILKIFKFFTAWKSEGLNNLKGKVVLAWNKICAVVSRCFVITLKIKILEQCPTVLLRITFFVWVCSISMSEWWARSIVSSIKVEKKVGGGGGGDGGGS